MKRRASDSWKRKMHPLFVEGAAVYRDSAKVLDALGPQAAAAQIAEINAQFRQKLEGLRKKFASVPLPATALDPLDLIFVNAGSSAWPPPQREVAQNFLEMLYWNRYREPLWIACQKMEAGDIEAYRRISRVGEDYQRRRFGKGTMSPPKGDVDHLWLFGLGLDLGLDELSPEELADCFDAVCSCNKVHDADSLKQQRLRLRQALDASKQWLQNAQAKIPSRERFFAFGMGGLWAKGFSMPGAPRRVYIGHIDEPATGFVEEQGTLGVLEGSRFANPAAQEQLPGAFGVSTTRELFAMFFPEETAYPAAPKNEKIL